MSSFKKTVSTLAFNPGMFDQLAFYSRRLKQEESVRRLGLVLIVITMVVQLFAALVPPEKSLAQSANDVVRGAPVTSIGDLRNKYYAQADVRALYNRFGITGGDIGASGVTNTDFGFQYQGAQGTRTVGRTNFQSTNDNYLGDFAGSNFYSRSAAEWQGSSPAYFFGQHTGTDNKKYYVWVIKDCGNIAYRPVNPADAFAPLPSVSPTPPPAPAPAAPPVAPPPPITATTPAPPPAPQVACTSLTASKITGKKSLKVTFTGAYSASPPSIVSNITFNFGDGTTATQTGTTVEHTYTNTTEQPVTYTAYLVVHSTLGDSRSPACQVTISVVPEVCTDNSTCTPPKRTKRVENITQHLTSAKTLLTTAKASDVLEYSLVTTNTNNVVLTNYVIEDYIGDLLNYSDIDQQFLKTQGGSFNAQKKIIIWSNQTIAPKAELKKDFRVTLKNPLPSTNRPNDTSPDFDCKMQNGYGNEVIVKVGCAPIKNIEELPNTGPGTALAAAFSLSTVSGYFIARARLLAKELGIIKRGWRG